VGKYPLYSGGARLVNSEDEGEGDDGADEIPIVAILASRRKTAMMESFERGEGPMFLLRGATVLLAASTLLAQSPFQSIPPAVSDTLSFRTPLADFEAKDIGGKTWRLADLQGRLTVISIFAAW